MVMEGDGRHPTRICPINRTATWAAMEDRRTCSRTFSVPNMLCILPSCPDVSTPSHYVSFSPDLLGHNCHQTTQYTQNRGVCNLRLSLQPLTSLIRVALSFPHDPILELRPPFPRSLPVQVILNGTVLTLSAVLFIQLLFTAQYHWPLAPVNFVLQLAAVFMLLVNATVSTHIVFKAVDAESRSWPYMLNYVAVDIPPSPPVYLNWPSADLTAWFLMTATCAGLIQVRQLISLLLDSHLYVSLDNAHPILNPALPVQIGEAPYLYHPRAARYSSRCHAVTARISTAQTIRNGRRRPEYLQCDPLPAVYRITVYLGTPCEPAECVAHGWRNCGIRDRRAYACTHVNGGRVPLCPDKGAVHLDAAADVGDHPVAELPWVVVVGRCGHGRRRG